MPKYGFEYLIDATGTHLAICGCYSKGGEQQLPPGGGWLLCILHGRVEGTYWDTLGESKRQALSHFGVESTPDGGIKECLSDKEWLCTPLSSLVS